MSRKPHESDFDPIRKSAREAHRFNDAWLKNGERLTWLQRISFAVGSLFFFMAGIYISARSLRATFAMEKSSGPSDGAFQPSYSSFRAFWD